MAKSKIERLTDEICTVGNLEEYRNQTRSILDMITDSGCTVSTRYDVSYSNIEDYIEGSNHIRVSMVNGDEPLTILWSLLHEFGHFLSGKKSADDSIVRREELAWRHADELLKKYPELLSKIDNYNAFKNKCLKSYCETFLK